jgi:hypothetical protein
MDVSVASATLGSPPPGKEEEMDLIGTAIETVVVLAVGLWLTAIARGLRKEISSLRTELKAEIAALRTELKAEIAEIRRELGELRSDLTRVALAVRAEPPRASGQ